MSEQLTNERLPKVEGPFSKLTEAELAELKETVVQTLFEAEQNLMEICREEDTRHQPQLDL